MWIVFVIPSTSWLYMYLYVYIKRLLLEGKRLSQASLYTFLECIPVTSSRKICWVHKCTMEQKWNALLFLEVISSSLLVLHLSLVVVFSLLLLCFSLMCPCSLDYFSVVSSLSLLPSSHQSDHVCAVACAVCHLLRLSVSYCIHMYILSSWFSFHWLLVKHYGWELGSFIEGDRNGFRFQFSQCVSRLLTFHGMSLWQIDTSWTRKQSKRTLGP